LSIPFPPPSPLPAGDGRASSAPEGALDRRATVRLRNCWLALRWSPNGPYWQDFQPSRNPVPWPDCFVARRTDAGFALDHLGEAIRWAFLDGCDAEAGLAPRPIAALFGDPDVPLATGKPLATERVLERRDGDMLVFRSLLLPFVDLRQRPVYVLGAVTWRRAGRGG
jgi:hypothetical protein